MAVTLIGERLAKEGKEFIYLGPNNECRNCKLKTVCFNLKFGRNYKISKIREKKHNCNVHDRNVVVVEVEELPITAALSKKHPVGSSVKHTKMNCKNIGCENFDICMNKAVEHGKTYTVKKIYEKMTCPSNFELYKAELAD